MFFERSPITNSVRLAMPHKEKRRITLRQSPNLPGPPNNTPPHPLHAKRRTSSSTLSLPNSPKLNSKSRHIKIRFKCIDGMPEIKQYLNEKLYI